MQARASALRRVGHSANRIALTKFGFIEKFSYQKYAARAKAADDTRLFLNAQHFFNNKNAVPTNGSDVRTNAVEQDRRRPQVESPLNILE